MSEGTTHSGVAIGVAGGSILGYMAFNYFTLREVSIMAVGVLISGMFYGSDSDVDTGNIHNENIRRFFGTDFFYNIWIKPYRAALKHRSPWSHWPILSAAYRFIYALFPFTINFIKDQNSTSKLSLFWYSLIAQLLSLPLLLLLYFIGSQFSYYILLLFIGFCVESLLHFIFDFKFLYKNR